MATSIAQFRPGRDDQEVLDLRAEVWGANHPHTTNAFYAWLFGDDSCGAASGILVRRDEKLVCFAGLVPRLAQCKGKTIRVAHGLDFMASPNLHGLSGLYAFKLVKAWLDHAREIGYDFAACYPNEQSIRLLISERLNWKIVASPNLLVLPTPSARFDETPVKFIPKELVNVGGKIAAALLLLVLPMARWQEEIGPLDLDADAAALDRLWQHADQSKCQFSRNAKVLQWRYGRHPVYDYRMLCRRKPGGLRGFIVTTHRKVMGVECVLVVDGVWEADDMETPQALLSAVYARARSEGIGIVGGLALKDTSFFTALTRARLIQVPAKLDPKPFHLVGFALSDAAKPYMAEGTWSTAWGDTDVV